MLISHCPSESYSSAPIAYPTTPPATEAIVHTVANHHARFGRASDIGSSMTSGGIGKKELSANDTAAKIQSA